MSFITFYPAIIVAALLGGFSRGLLAIILSSLAAWYLFIPSYSGWLEYHAAVSIALFSIVSLVNVGLVFLLDTAVHRAMAQEQNVRTLIQSAPNGVLVVDNEGRITLVNASLEHLLNGLMESESQEKIVGVCSCAIERTQPSGSGGRDFHAEPGELTRIVR